MSQESTSSVGSVTVEERQPAALKGGKCPAVAGMDAHVQHFEKAAGMTIAQLAAGVKALKGGSKRRRKGRRGGVKHENATAGQKLAAGCLAVIALGLAAGVSAYAIVWILNATGYFTALENAMAVLQAKVMLCGTVEGVVAQQMAAATASHAVGATTAKFAVMTCSEAVGQVEIVATALQSAKWWAGLKAATGTAAAAGFGFVPIYNWILSWFPEPASLDVACEAGGGGGGQKKMTDFFKKQGGHRRGRRTHRRRRRHRRRTKRRRRKTRHHRRSKHRRTRHRRRRRR